MSLNILFESPTTANHSAPVMAPGTLVQYNHATYGTQVYRYVQHKDAVTVTAGMVAVLASATGLNKVTNDVAGGSAIGTAGDAAVPQMVVGVYVNVPTADYYCYVLAKGVGSVKTDDGVSAGNRLVAHTADGTSDTMADGEEEQTFGVALADDNDTTHLVLAAINCVGT